MGFRIVVDLDLCQGHGVCESEAPDLFEVDDERKVVVLDDAPPDDQRKAAELAVKYCPTHALSIVTEPTERSDRGEQCESQDRSTKPGGTT
jgi:sterol 14-demethylase